jgi:chemotaxis protein CheZ
MARVTNELDAIVGGTEKATEQILSNSEEIDQMAATLAARLKDDHAHARSTSSSAVRTVSR